ncbi:MAG: Ubiquinone biosynthesis O-methyltransferase [Chlamydiae bacterium]|nr:Ubiquinone biosynthesis O-methyltransferase [Chlamydiota bacterium]
MARKTRTKVLINNAFYDDLGEMWNEAENHPVSLLRAENRFRSPWIVETIQQRYNRPIDVVDLGCGGGFLTHALAEERHRVVGIDLSESSLTVARNNDPTKQVHYQKGDACNVDLPERSFDVVCATDILEHVERPELLISEAARLLRKGGLFFFHTFNRTPLSYLLIIKGVEWFVQNTPPRMHLYNLFIKPKELREICQSEGLVIEEMKGFSPKIMQLPLLKMLLTRKVPENFRFHFTSSLKTGYIGFASK